MKVISDVLRHICENRTYGYYADVDNDCQVFHVCLTSQTSAGRNVTYRWSFICPYETMFNQEVLTCARPRDSIDCADSPLFFYMNDDIGKVPEDDGQTTEGQKGQNTQNTEVLQTSSIRNKDRRKPPMKKQNIIVEKLMTEVKKENLMAEEIEDDYGPVIEIEMTPQEAIQDKEKEREGVTKKEVNTKKRVSAENDMETKMEKVDREVNMEKKRISTEKDMENKEKVKETEVNMEKKKLSVKKQKPIIHEVGQEYEMKDRRMENERLSSERSLRRGKKMSRGSLRFKANSFRSNL